MNIVKNFTTIHLLLNWINVLQVVILLMSNLTEGLNLSMYNMITGINKLKKLTKHVSCEENLIQINGGIMRNVDVNVKDVMYVKKILFRIMIRVVVKIENI